MTINSILIEKKRNKKPQFIKFQIKMKFDINIYLM